MQKISVSGGTSDTFEREDGLPGLEQTYGTFNFKSKNTFDNSLKYQAMENDEVDCVPGLHHRCTAEQ